MQTYQLQLDFIGAYTWYKKIESKGKSTISKKEVTIVPPDQYKLRFCKEIFNYFIPVLGKCTLKYKYYSSNHFLKENLIYPSKVHESYT